MGKYKKYKKEELEKALKCTTGSKGVRKAAAIYGIAPTTLWRHATQELKGHPVRMITKDEEMALVSYIKYSQEHSMPLTSKMIKTFVRGIVKKSGRQSTIGENGPSNKWFRSFLSRHPDLKMRKPQSIDGGRVRMGNATVMRQHFELLQSTMEKHGLLNKPEQVFNFDETGFGRGITAQDKVCTANGNTLTKTTLMSTHTTAAVCVSASGQVLPTFLIYEKSFPSGAYRDGIPGNWLFATSPNGYIDSELFMKWFEQIFLVHAPKARPLLLTMDNHESHLSVDLIKLARANQVELLCLPPHTTHILQPLDVGLFRPIKKAVCDFAVSLGYANSSLVIGKNRLAQLLKAAIDKACSVHHIKNSFRKCGMFPFNPNAIDKSKLAPPAPNFQVPGPGGDNCANNNEPVDPLCETCGQFIHGHPLVTEGLIPADLASILVPIKEAAKKKKTRIVTKSRVITGDEIYTQLVEKEQQKKQKKITKGGTKTTFNESNNEENLPTLKHPRRRQTKNASKILTAPQQPSHTLAAEEYTCGVCHLRGFEDDEEQGILWVGCDNSDCGTWYHRDCLPTRMLMLTSASLKTRNGTATDVHKLMKVWTVLMRHCQYSKYAKFAWSMFLSVKPTVFYFGLFATYVQKHIIRNAFRMMYFINFKSRTGQDRHGCAGIASL